MELKIGTILHNGTQPYEVEAVLGSGGFGITYRVSTSIKIGNEIMTQKFALKEHFVKKHCERDNTGAVTCSGPSSDIVSTTKADFKAEAQRLINIRHQNIVKVKEQFEENNTVYYVMDYLNGENLREYVLNRTYLTEKETFDMLFPICDAIKTIHSCNTTHLDIKPANMMLKRQRSGNVIPVLIDFGLAKHYDKNGNATSTMRTQGCSDGYAPIEQYAGIETFSPQADIYALAASFCFCLTGKRPPIATELEDEVLIAKLLPQRIHINVRSAIVHAMLPARRQRTKSVDEFVNELRQGCEKYKQVCQENYLDPSEDKPRIERAKPTLSDNFSSSSSSSSNQNPSKSTQNSMSTSASKPMPEDNRSQKEISRNNSNRVDSLPPQVVKKPVSDSKQVKGHVSTPISKPVTPPPPISTSNPISTPPVAPPSISGIRKDVSRPLDSYSNPNPNKTKISTIPSNERDIYGSDNGGFKKKNNGGLKTFFIVLLVLALIAGIVWGIIAYEPSDKGAIVDPTVVDTEMVYESYSPADSVAADSVM